TSFKETSAWAGIHYFAARNGRGSNTESQDVVTWPEGNGWLAHKLAEPIGTNTVTGALTYGITDHGHSVTVDYWDNKLNQSCQIKAKTAIIATPRFIGSHIVKTEGDLSANEFSYAPWVVANITLSKLPEGKGVPLCWDNMIYKSN